MGHRTVFTLSMLMMVLFFLLSNFDRYFFTLHFLESVIYLVILLLLFYGLEDWAYVIGFVTPLFWIMLSFLQGTLLAGVRALALAASFQGVRNPIDLVSGLLFLAGLGLMVASGRAFRREVWGTRGALRTAVLATAVVGAYYAVLIGTLFRMSRPTG